MQAILIQDAIGKMEWIHVKKRHRSQDGIHFKETPLERWNPS